MKKLHENCNTEKLQKIACVYYQPTRLIKYKVIIFAPSNKSIMANQLWQIIYAIYRRLQAFRLKNLIKP